MIRILCHVFFEDIELFQLSSYEVLGEFNALCRSVWMINFLVAE